MKSFHPRALAAAAACALSACGGSGDDGDKAPVNAAPAGVFGIQTRSYDGASDDLLTAGLGKAGLQGALPAYADPLHPTVAELRRAAMYTSYRGLIDTTENSPVATSALRRSSTLRLS